ncbi:hypothetical protein CEXT_576011 [Caerostris extrusa]|uniref:Uncharacterized protein n=1 Tax=Caerostris extrusa TaxID=172846 RepID=A0AAV4MS56_CAEEX|nr:hypothetical protein CEXT_576011 [Caerostris extrusa]
MVRINIYLSRSSEEFESYSRRLITPKKSLRKDHSLMLRHGLAMYASRILGLSACNRLYALCIHFCDMTLPLTFNLAVEPKGACHWRSLLGNWGKALAFTLRP